MRVEKPKTIYTTLRWWEWILIIVAFLSGSIKFEFLDGSEVWDYRLGMVSAILAGIGFGVWRCVQFLAQLTMLKQAEYEMDDEA